MTKLWVPELLVGVFRRKPLTMYPGVSLNQPPTEAHFAAAGTGVQSFSDPEARLYYRFYLGTLVGDKHVCVVVKVSDDDAFVLTAYLADKPKKGIQIWPTNE